MGQAEGLHPAPIILPTPLLSPSHHCGPTAQWQNHWVHTDSDWLCQTWGWGYCSVLEFPFWALRGRALDSRVMGPRTQREDGCSHGGEMSLAWIFCGSYMYGISPQKIAYFNRICKRVNWTEDPFLFICRECSQLRSIQFCRYFSGDTLYSVASFGSCSRLLLIIFQRHIMF